MSGVAELKTLHTALVDARKGYDEAIRNSEKPELTALFEKVRALHGAAHDDVHKMLAALGEKPDDAGSFMSTVHEAVINVRSAVVGLDEGALSSFASGEENNVEKYDEAIAAAPSGAESLRGHKTKLVSAIAEMQAMAT